MEFPLACRDRRSGGPIGEDHVLGLSIWKLAIIGGIIVLLFGKGKISGMMGDLAQGIKSFKKGMSEDDSAKAIDQQPIETVASVKEKASG
jgi:sec-independent protein translocase protein TatA